MRIHTSRPRRGWLLLAVLLPLLCLAGCAARTSRSPATDRAVAAAPTPVPPVATFTPVPTPSPTFTPTSTPTPTRLPTATPTPTPSLTRSGAYDNLTEHRDGRYALQRSGSRVAATFATSRSPVQHWAKAVTEPLFTVPEGFRPPYPILRTVEGRPVTRTSTPDPNATAPRRILLRVNPDGAVHYADDDHVEGVGYLAYSLDTVWGTTPVANDRAVLEILDAHWFGETFLSAWPPPENFVTLDADGRVTALGTGRRILNGSLPPELGQLHQLEHLDLSYDGRTNFHLKDDVARRLLSGRLSKFPNVTEADMEWVREQMVSPGLSLTGAIPPQLGQLSRLRHLDLGSNLLIGNLPPEIARLAALEHLDLGDNWLPGPLLPELGQLRNLEYLDLRNNLLTGVLPPEWGQLASLQKLHLSNNRHLTGPLPPEWGQLASLELLSLGNNQLTDSLPPEWGQLANLQTLDLGHNGLTGSLPPEWGQFTSLQKLGLSFNQLTGPLPPEWGQLASLEQLSLHGNQLTGSLPPEWRQLASLELLSLHRNQLTGCFHRIDFPNLINIRTGLPECPPVPMDTDVHTE